MDRRNRSLVKFVANWTDEWKKKRMRQTIYAKSKDEAVSIWNACWDEPEGRFVLVSMAKRRRAPYETDDYMEKVYAMEVGRC